MNKTGMLLRKAAGGCGVSVTLHRGADGLECVETIFTDKARPPHNVTVRCTSVYKDFKGQEAFFVGVKNLRRLVDD